MASVTFDLRIKDKFFRNRNTWCLKSYREMVSVNFQFNYTLLNRCDVLNGNKEIAPTNLIFCWKLNSLISAFK